MQRRYLLFFLIGLVIFLCCGCGEGTYIAEKKFWQAEQKLNSAIKKYEKENAIPQKEIDELLFLFKEIALRYPFWEKTSLVRFKLAKLYELKNNEESAIKEYETICHDFSTQKEYCANAKRRIAGIFEKQNNWAKAEKIYKDIIEENPYTLTGILVPLYLAQQYEKKGESEKSKTAFSEAIEFYKKAIAENPQTLAAASSVDFLVICFLSQGQAQEAVETLKTLIQKYPDSVIELRALLKTAQIFQNQLGQKEEAKGYYEKLLKKYPKENLAIQAQEELKRLTE